MKFFSIKSWVVFCVVLLASGITVQAKAEDDKGDKVIARVDGYSLTVSEFEEEMKGMPPQLQIALLQNPQLKEQLLERWVQMNLLALAARDAGLDKDPAVRKRIEQVTNNILAREYFKQKLAKRLEVSDKEIEEYYQKHKDEFKADESVKARHILIRVPEDAKEKDWKAAKEKAEKIRKELLAGGDFAELARKYSEDPGSRDNGGELGYFGRGRMIPEFEKAAFGLKKGEISEPVKTTFGYHIIQVQDRKKAGVQGLEEVRETIRQKIVKQKEDALQEDVMTRLKKKYPVTIDEALLKEVELPLDAMHQGFKSPH